MAKVDEIYQQTPFNLNEGEKIVTSVKPVWMGYFLRYSIGHIIGGIVFSFIFSFWIGALVGNAIGSIIVGLAIGFVGLLVLIILVSFVAAKISYGKFTVWLTDERIVSSRGLIGFNTESMPLENIVDVVLQRGLVDRILGLSSIMAVPMGGMVMYGRSSNFSTIGFIPALNPDQATKLQKQIFDLRNARKKSLKEG